MINKFIKIFRNSCLIYLMTISFVLAEKNTSWIISDSSGHEYVVRFNSDGTCHYFLKKTPSGGSTERIYDNCNWVRNNKVLVFETNSYYRVVIGIIEGRSMTGYHISNYEEGVKGTLTGRRVDN